MARPIIIKDTNHDPITTIDLEEVVAALLDKEATAKVIKEISKITLIQITCHWASLSKSHNSSILRLQSCHKTISNLWATHQLILRNSQNPSREMLVATLQL
jgi:hypothetical protein